MKMSNLRKKAFGAFLFIGAALLPDIGQAQTALRILLTGSMNGEPR
jgi:hypothetical protein